MTDKALISIIVPVYNVEKYMDECMDSLVNQSYQNLEIVLVNDGSTDSSYEICQKWRERDKRIRLLDQDNRGQGAARNRGVKEAKGDWIAFVDADDWIDDRYIEVMMNAVIKEGADMARCNYAQIRLKSGGEKSTNFYQTLGMRKSVEDILAESAGVIWNQIVKRQLLIENKIEQPKCKGQDSAVGLELCLLAKKIAFVNEPLYFYRREREGATTYGAASKREEVASIAMPWLVENLQKCGLYNGNRMLIQRYIAYLLTQTLWGGWLSDEQEKYDQLRELYGHAFQKLTGIKNKIIASFGSWNVTETAKKIAFVQDMDYAFNFSGMISLMNRCGQTVEFFHKNVYRSKMIKKDIYSDLWSIFEAQKPDCFIMDLLEERNDIIKYAHGFMTKSVAAEQAEMKYGDAVIIEFGSDEWVTQWKLAADTFINKIQEYVSQSRIVLVKNLLTERYGTVFKSKEYEAVNEIKRINHMLERCYKYITDRLPDCKVIDLTKDERYITDEKYEYGIEPYYINSFINKRAAELILEDICFE